MLIHLHTHTVDVQREELFRIAKFRARTHSGSRAFNGEMEAKNEKTQQTHRI